MFLETSTVIGQAPESKWQSPQAARSSDFIPWVPFLHFTRDLKPLLYKFFFCVCDWTTTQIIASKFQISRDIWADFHLVMTISNTIFVRFTIICYPGSMWWQLLSGRQGQVKSFQWPKPFVRRKPHACYRLLLAGAVLLYLKYPSSPCLAGICSSSRADYFLPPPKKKTHALIRGRKKRWNHFICNSWRIYICLPKQTTRNTTC